MTNQKKSVIKPYKGKFSSILLFGPPGSGKATLGKFLANAGAQYYLPSTDIFRRLATYSPAGELYYSYASKDMLLPDEATIEIWNYYVQGLIATNSYYPESQDLLMDGIPRTLRQAEMLEDFIEVRHVIVLEIANKKELLKRMQTRARAEGKIEEIAPEVIEKRMETYAHEIEEIRSFYPRHLVSVVNADQRSLEVLRDVLVRLSHLLSRGGPKADSQKK